MVRKNFIKKFTYINFLDKTGTLTEDKIDISGFLPVKLEYRDKNKLISELVFEDEISLKEIINCHKTYWKNFCRFKSRRYKNTNSKEYFEEILDHPSNRIIYFVESLFTCNNLEKINHIYYGDSLDKKLYEENNWILKPKKIFGNISYKRRSIVKENFIFNNINQNEENSINDINDNNSNKVEKYFQKGFLKQKSNTRRNNLINKSETIEYEIYPKYFHKITENLKMNDTDNIFFDKYYKLGVLKRFNYINTFQTLSVVVKSYFDNSIRYFIKGAPEKIFKLCKEDTLPKNYHDRLMHLTKVKK